MSLSSRSHRPLIMGSKGAVGANHPAAALTGLDILRAGGNAFDATVAIALSLGVVEPMMAGLGGDGIYQTFLASSSKSLVFNGTGAAPSAATPDRFRATGLPIRGPLSVSVPGALAALSAIHGSHGRLPWAQLVAPAIELAREGFPVTHLYCYFANRARDVLESDERSARTFLAAGSPAALVRQPDLARTLEEIATDGADTFYRGNLAKRLVASMRPAGILVDADDLALCVPELTKPIRVTYRGFVVNQTPPNSSGFMLLQMLKIIECFDLTRLGPEQRVHIMVEAKKLAFQDCERYCTDPSFGEIPLDRLLSDDYAAECAAKINLTRAADLRLAEPEFVDGNTTYFCVVDAEGNAVSAIQSLNSSFGSGMIAGDTGILLNNRMPYWHLAGDHPNRLLPRKRVRHTMNAPMVFKEDQLWAVEGTPGGDNQVQVNLQMLSAMIDFDMDPQAAAELPRWSSCQRGQGVDWPHEGDDSLTIEPGFGSGVLIELGRLGHRLNRIAALEGPCNVQAIRIMENGVRVVGSDPRGDGWAAAY